MVINKDNFCKFLKILSLKGDMENKEALANISDKALEVIICHSSKVVALRGVLKGNFENIGEIGIDSLPFLNKCVNSLTGDIDLSKKDNKLVLKTNKLKISCILRNPTYIQNKLDNPTFNKILKGITAKTVILTKSQIKELIKYYTVIGSNDLSLVNKEGKLSIVSEKNENESVGIIDTEVKEKFNVRLSRVFIDVLSVIEDDIKVVLSNDSPAYIRVDNDNYNFDILIQRKM